MLMRSRAPPVNMLNMPANVPSFWSKKRGQLQGVNAGHRNVGADAIDQQSQ